MKVTNDISHTVHTLANTSPSTPIMSKRRLSGTGSGTSGGEKASRLSLSEGQLQALEAAFVGSSRLGVEALSGEEGEARGPLTRFLDSVKGSIFVSLRASLAAATHGGVVGVPSGSEGEAGGVA